MQQIEHHAPEAVEPAAEAASPRPRFRPPFITLALIGVNFLMAFAQVAASGGIAARTGLGTAPAKWALGAKVTTLIAHGEYWRLITANFLHGSPTHLLNNMFWLLFLGFWVETFYGPARFLVIYVMAAVIGVVGSYLFTPGESLGASTGIMGLLGALLIHNAKYRPYLPPWINRTFPFLVLLVLFTLMMSGAQGMVDFQGHLWGLAGGAVMAALLESRVAGVHQNERDWLPLPTALATAALLLLYGGLGLVLALPGEMAMLRSARSRDHATAITNLETVVAARPYFVEAKAELADELQQANRTLEADRIYETLLKENPRNPYLRTRAAFYYFTLGVKRDNEHRSEEAADRFRRAADLFDEENRLRAEAENAYAWTLADHLHRDLDEALRYALRAAEDRPYSGGIADTVAWIYYQKGKYPEALAQQNRAVKLWKEESSNSWLESPEERQDSHSGAELYYHLGVIQEKLRQTEDARRSYAAALRLQPGHTEASEALRKLTQPHTEPSGPGRDLTPRLIVPKRDVPTTI